MKIDGKKTGKIIIQALIVAGVFFAVSKWQTSGLLGKGAAAPDFTLGTLEGGEYTLSETTGRKRLVYFFSPWCRICKFSSHNIVSLRSSFAKDDLEIVAVALSWDSEAEVREFAREHDLNVPVVLGDRALGAAYRIRAYPTFYVIDERGLVSGFSTGYTTELGLRFRLL